MENVFCKMTIILPRCIKGTLGWLRLHWSILTRATNLPGACQWLEFTYRAFLSGTNIEAPAIWQLLPTCLFGRNEF